MNHDANAVGRLREIRKRIEHIDAELDHVCVDATRTNPQTVFEVLFTVDSHEKPEFDDGPETWGAEYAAMVHYQQSLQMRGAVPEASHRICKK